MRRDRDRGASRWSKSALLDSAFKWGMGILWLWFGVGLLLGRVHFY